MFREIERMAKKQVRGICGLCSTDDVLEESHVIPKFVSRRRATEELTPYMRTAHSPNRRIQDLPKRHFLCGSCEDRFSIGEKYFAETIDSRYADKTIEPFICTEQQYYFAISIMWRCLVMVPDYPLTEAGNEFIKNIADGLRPYLLRKSGIPEKNTPFVHLYFIPYFIDGTDKEGNLLPAPDSINVRLHGAIGPVLLADGDNIYLTIFLAGMMLVCPLSLDGPRFIAWTFYTQMTPGEPIVPLGCKGPKIGNIADKKFWRCIENWVAEEREVVSDKQYQIMKKDFRAVPEEARNRSPALRAMFIDHVNKTRRQK